jgi:type 1 fimbriae regulatory protein FimB/type 1 fimbriae regulatory protein FimE
LTGQIAVGCRRHDLHQRVDFARQELTHRKTGEQRVFKFCYDLPKLRALKREDGASRYVFMTERKAPMTPAGFRKMLARLAVGANFQFSVHPHMLRHACGYKLANDGRDTRALQHYLGHKNIMHTVRYTELSPERFKNFWED